MDPDGPPSGNEADIDTPSTPSKEFIDKLSSFRFLRQPAGQSESPLHQSSSFNKTPTSTPAKKRTRAVATAPETISGTPKKRKSTTGYEPPQTFAHLSVIPDRIQTGLDILFCGINPGVVSAKRGFHFAHPSNCFYRVLHDSGLTDTRLAPDESPTLPERYNMGLTDLVARPSSNSSQLSKEEKVKGVPELLRKISMYKPRIVCFIGKEIADAVDFAVRRQLRLLGQSSILQSPAKKASAPSNSQAGEPSSNYTSPLVDGAPGFRFMPFKMLHQQSKDLDGVAETLFFTSPSTSGLVTQYRLEDRVQLFKLLKTERDAMLAGAADAQDTSQYIPIPSSLYN